MKHRIQLLALAFVFFFTVSSAQTKTEVLTNKSVVSMCKAGLGTDIVLAKIESSTCKFDVSTDGLIALKTGKVPEEVIQAMVSKSNGKKAEAKTPANTSPSTGTAKQPQPAQTGNLDFINVPHYLDKSKNSLRVLERSTVAVKAKVNLIKAMIPGTSTPIVFRMDSVSSPVRLPQLESVSFMINTGTNIPEIFGLYRMSASKNRREATWFNVSAFDNKSDKDVIAFNYRKVREGVYEIVPVSKLEKGEYCFVNKASYTTYGGAKADVFAFGVD
jgi:hypothetical protein